MARGGAAKAGIGAVRWPADAQTRRLVHYCAFNGTAASVAAVMLIALRVWLIHSDWLYVLAAVLAVFLVTLVAAVHRLGRGQTSAGVVLIAVGNWTAMLPITLLVPYTLTILPLAALLPALLAIPHLDRRGVQAMFATTVFVVASLSLLGRLQRGAALEARTPEWALAAAQVVFVPSVAGLAAYVSFKNISALRSRAEALRVSRARLVGAAVRERRRIERDLHDGAQQFLVAAAMQIKVAQRTATDPTRPLNTLLNQTAEMIQNAVTELCDLAHGIYPSQLASHGLEAALRTTAQQCPLPVTVTTHAVARYPLDVETNVYFTCLEAIQNAVKHAGPDAEITITLDGSHGLTITITDTGPGADPHTLRTGHGITNMTDRIGAIGGTLTTTTTSTGTGVHIHTHIPRVSLLAPAGVPPT